MRARRAGAVDQETPPTSAGCRIGGAAGVVFPQDLVDLLLLPFDGWLLQTLRPEPPVGGPSGLDQSQAISTGRLCAVQCGVGLADQIVEVDDVGARKRHTAEADCDPNLRGRLEHHA